MDDDEKWLLEKYGVVLSDSMLESFAERVGIKMDNEMDVEDARSQTYQEMKWQ